MKPPVPYVEQRDYVGTDFYRGGMVRKDIGALHPTKFHAELLRVALAAVLVVHSNTRVISIEKNGEGFCVVTSAGKVRAGQGSGLHQWVHRWRAALSAPAIIANYRLQDGIALRRARR